MTRGGPRIAALVMATLCALGAALPAWADIWGYVDATGRAHMASEKLDERYQLFFKGTQRVGGPALPAGQAAAVATGTPTPVVPVVDTSAAESFRRSSRFVRTTSQSNVKRFEALIEKAAKAQRIDPALVKAVVAVESSFQPDAVSPKGARGLMQVIPDTAERYGVVGDRRKSAGQKLLDPATNLRVGASHLSNLLSMFKSNLELALAAYNAGEGAVLKYAMKIPPFPETQEYVKLVKQFYAGFLPPAKKAEPAAATVMLAANTRNTDAPAVPADTPSTVASPDSAQPAPQQPAMAEPQAAPDVAATAANPVNGSATDAVTPAP